MPQCGHDAAAGRPLYSPADQLIGNNYPPLSFYAIGYLGHFVGDNLFVGRAKADIWARLADRHIAVFESGRHTTMNSLDTSLSRARRGKAVSSLPASAPRETSRWPARSRHRRP